MKGLIIKDFYSLRVSIRTTVWVGVFSLLISVMCIMSMQHGNLAKMSQGVVEDSMVPAMANIMWRIFLSLLIFLPMTLMANVTLCFQEDEKAGFQKVENSLPLSAFQIVSARFATMLIFGGATFLYSTALAVVCGMLSPDFGVWELLGVNITVAGILMMTVSVTNFVMFVKFGKYADFLTALPIFILIFAMNAIILEGSEEVIIRKLESIVGFAGNSFGWIGLFSLLVTICAYVGSLLVVKKKRG